MNKLEIGQEIETTVVQVSNDTVFIDLGLKSEGFIDKAEFVDDNGSCSVKEGDKIKAYFISSTRDELHFTTKLKGQNADTEVLESAFKSQMKIEGHVEKEIKGGFEVKIGSARAFCPYSQMGYKNRLEPAQYVGRTESFVITEYKNEGKNIIVSNRKLLEAEELEQSGRLAQKLTEGTVVEGTVKSIQSYGAFVDVEGFQALLPTGEISHAHIMNAGEVLKEGQKITAKIIRADWNTQKPERSKVTLSLKALEKDPWDSVESELKVGQKISGKVSRTAGFGVFVNLIPGVDGLVHISQIEGVSATTNLAKMFKPGDNFDVVIQKIDLGEKRISLAPATSVEQDNDAASYLADQDDDGETFNPFAALLKK
jgi:small subunit ribosomal protein S1